KHPPGLYVLFVTEMWERFSFYSMLNLLTLYMDARTDLGGLGFAPEVSAQVYGLYKGLLYFSPLLGGLIADRWWGFTRTILVGGAAMMCGPLALAGEGLALFFVGLGCLIVGNGLFKPNISTMLGNLYEHRPDMKDRGFSIFYMGINLGSLSGTLTANLLRKMFVVDVPAVFGAGTVGLATSPLVAATTLAVNQQKDFGQRFGWHYAFAAAALGMLLSLVVFAACRRWVGAGGRPADRPLAAAAELPPEVERQRV